jgi:hypothetical protein
MHTDQTHKGLGLASEMSPVSWALFYGLKAVHVPQPIYHAYGSDTHELNLRANSRRPVEISAGWNSIWSWNRHNDTLMNMSYMFASEFPENFIEPG